MQFPVTAEDVKIVQGSSGKGLQVVCSCGCVNWNHVEIQISLWTCRNCERVLSHYFPGLVEATLKLATAQPPAAAVPAKS